MGWLTSRCHTTAQKPSVCGVTRSAGDGRNDDARVGDLLRVAAVAADDAEHFGPDLACQLERAHEVHADVLLAVAAADAEDENTVARPQARAA